MYNTCISYICNYDTLYITIIIVLLLYSRTSFVKIRKKIMNFKNAC